MREELRRSVGVKDAYTKCGSLQGPGGYPLTRRGDFVGDTDGVVIVAREYTLDVLHAAEDLLSASAACEKSSGEVRSSRSVCSFEGVHPRLAEFPIPRDPRARAYAAAIFRIANANTSGFTSLAKSA
jgi:hypothetical protein